MRMGLLDTRLHEFQLRIAPCGTLPRAREGGGWPMLSHLKTGALVIGLAAMLVTLAGVAGAQGIYPGVAARINGVEISNESWQRSYREMLAERNVNIVTQRNSSRMEALRRETLETLIDQELAWQAAQKASQFAAPEDVDKVIADVRASFATPDGFARKLSGEGYTEASYRDHVRRLLSGRMYLDHIAAAAVASLTDAEVEAFYADNPTRLTLPERVHARYILLRLGANASAEERKAAKSKLTRIRKQTRNVADFAEMAKKHSDDGTASAGGDLGVIRRGQIEKPAEDAAFATRPGRMSEVIESPEALFLVFVEEHLPARLLSLAEVREQLRDYLRHQKSEEAIKGELERLRSAGKVEILATF